MTAGIRHRSGASASLPASNGLLSSGLLANAGPLHVGIFLATAFATTLGTAWAMWLMPETFLRFMLVFADQYDLTASASSDKKQVPGTGGALAVFECTSFIDGSSSDREPRSPDSIRRRCGIMSTIGPSNPSCAPCMSFPSRHQAVFVSSSKALREAGKVLHAADLVPDLPAGQKITGTGNLADFRRGFDGL